MKYIVFYRTDEAFRDAYRTNTDNIDPAHYYVVGRVEASDLEDLFRRMNYVDGSEVEYVGRGKLEVRSLSVGDVALDEQGVAHLCASVGWEAFTGKGFDLPKERTCKVHGHHCERHNYIERLDSRRPEQPAKVWAYDPHGESRPADLYQGTKQGCQAYIDSFQGLTQEEQEEHTLPKFPTLKLEESDRCLVCDLYDARREATSQGRMPPFFVVAWGIGTSGFPHTCPACRAERDK